MMNTDSANRYAPPQAAVADAIEDDGEQLASRGTRLGAVLLDGFIWALLVYTPMMIGSWSSISQTIVANRGNTNAASLSFRMYGAVFRNIGGTAGTFMVLGLIICIALNIYFVRKNGQSIGKKLCGIKVVRKDGSKAGLGRIFWLRNFVSMLPNFIPFAGGIYSLADPLFIFSESRRCLHDRIADTIVVKA